MNKKEECIGSSCGCREYSGLGIISRTTVDKDIFEYQYLIGVVEALRKPAKVDTKCNLSCSSWNKLESLKSLNIACVRNQK